MLVLDTRRTPTLRALVDSCDGIRNRILRYDFVLRLSGPAGAVTREYKLGSEPEQSLAAGVALGHFPRVDPSVCDGGGGR